MVNNVFFNNVARLGENEYLTFCAGRVLVDLWKDGTIEYNPDIQRGAKIKVNKKNETVVKPIFSHANVKKIEQEMIEGRYCTDMITFNVEDGNMLDYKNSKLCLKEGYLSILDGHHRIRALVNIEKRFKKDPTRLASILDNLIFPVKITNYDLKKAQQQFYQFSLGLKISSSRAQYFNQKDWINVLIREIIEESALKDKVELIRNTIPKKEEKNVVSFATLVNSIKNNFEDITQTEEEKQELKEYLIKFFNLLFEVVPEFNDFEERNILKSTSLLPENIMFYGFAALSKEIKDNENWEDIVRSIRNIDLNKDSQNWLSKVTKEGSKGYSIINSEDSRRYLSNMFVKLVKERNKMLSK